MARPRIGEMLVQKGRIDAVQLQSALAHQRRWGGRLGRALVKLGFLPERALLEVVGDQLGVPFVEIGERSIPPQVLALVPGRLVRSRKALPLERLEEGRRGRLVVALADPADLTVLDEIAFAAGLDVLPVLAAEEDLERAIARHLDGVLILRDVEFSAREDAIDLDDDAPLPLVRDPVGGPGKRPLN